MNEVKEDVRRFVAERIDRIRRLPDLEMSKEDKVYWIDRFSFAGHVLLSFATDCTNIMPAKEGKELYTELNNATLRAKRKVTGSALYESGTM